MNEWFKKVFGQLKDLWSKWKLTQKIILIAVAVAVIVALAIIVVMSSRETEVVLFNSPVTEEKSEQIMMRLEEENIAVFKNKAGQLVVKDASTAKKAKNILFREGLTDDFDPWTLFDMERWSTTDFERDVNLRRSIESEVKKFIKSLDDIDDADVIITPAEKSVFKDSQKPAKASVILHLKPGSTFGDSSNPKSKKQIKSLQSLILKAVSGLTEENIVIADSEGNQLNDFEGMKDLERVDITKREQKLIQDMAKVEEQKVYEALKAVLSPDRISKVNVTIEMDMSEDEKNITEYTPIVKKIDNPDTPYDDSEIQDSLILSEENISKKWTGTGINPEGPAGVEGQNPPVYSDMSNLYGTDEESSVKRNHALNSTQTHRIAHPKPGRRTISVIVDGRWIFVRDDKGKFKIDPKTGGRERVFEPVTPEEIAKFESAIKGSVGYDKNRGDIVSIECIQFDKTKYFADEDSAWKRAQQAKITIFYVLAGVVAVFGVFLVIVFVSKEMEKRRRQREEELLRQSQLEREKVLWNAEQSGMEVTMSVEEKRRAELQENAISAAKDHPEDVAQLIRTWLMEE